MSDRTTIAIACAIGTAFAISMASFVAPVASADSARQQLRTAKPAKPSMARLRAAADGTELRCSGPVGHKTCTSNYAFVCPSGWHACTLKGEAKTCCTQD